MKIAICGSMKFFAEMQDLKKQLEEYGFIVSIPKEEGTDVDYAKLSSEEQAQLKKEFIDLYMPKIQDSDAVLVANYPKYDQEDYIGANTFLEMGFAYAFKKQIYLLYGVPNQPNEVEIRGLDPIPLKGDISLIRKH